MRVTKWICAGLAFLAALHVTQQGRYITVAAERRWFD